MLRHGHARQVDRSMIEARRIAAEFGSRIAQLHVSDVDHDCRHHALSRGAVLAFKYIQRLLPCEAPIVLESEVAPAEIDAEIQYATAAFAETDCPSH